jgi:hypothetical protein
MLRKLFALWNFESRQYTLNTADDFYREIIIPCLRILYDSKLFIPRSFIVSYTPSREVINLKSDSFEVFEQQFEQIRQETNYKVFDLFGDIEIFTTAGSYLEPEALFLQLEFRPDYPMFSVSLYSNAFLPLRLDEDYQYNWNIDVYKCNKNRLFNALEKINSLNCWDKDVSLMPVESENGMYSSGLHIFNLRKTLEDEYALNPPKEVFDIADYFREMGIE